MVEALNPRYRRYHPRWYRKRLPIFWWLGRLAYTRFITRELTSLAVGYCAVLLLLEVCALRRGAEAFERLAGVLWHPVVVAFHTAVLLVLVYHTVTWLNLAPKALVVRLGGRRLPDAAVLAGHYAAWLAASVLVAWIVLGW